MKYILSVLFFLLFEVAVFSNPNAQQGILDLRSFNFQDSIAAFDGELKFYWNTFIKSEAETNFSDETLINIAYSWDNQPSNLKTFSNKGYATYHLKILIAEENVGKYFILRPKHFIAYASEVYVNGILTSNSGSVGKSLTDEHYKPSRKSTAYIFTADSTVLNVFIQSANFDHFRAGIFQDIEFGYAKNMSQQREKDITSNLIVIVILFSMFFYHWLFFLVNRREITSFFFGITCLLFAIDLSFQGPMCFFLVFPDASFAIHSTIHLITPFLLPSSFVFFLYSIFPTVTSKTIRNITAIISVVFIAAVSFGTSEVNSLIVKPHYIYMLMLISYVYYIAIKASIKKIPGSTLFLVAYCIFSLCAINDLLNNFEIIHTTNLVSTGLIVFVLLLSVMHGQKMTEMYDKIVALSEHLKGLNIGLEKKVKERTQKLESALQKNIQLKKFQDDITNMIVHDLKSPLNTLINLPADYSPREKEEIRKSLSYKMLNLVLNILNVKKYGEIELIPHIQNVALKEVWESVEKQLQYSIRIKNITLHVCDVNYTIVKTDKNLLERVLVNLLDNAIKYVRYNGVIDIHCKVLTSNMLQIEINDDGIGIPEDLLPLIFEKYKQSSTVEYSTGLGLTFCKVAIKAMGGEISIKSKIDEGTQVSFTIPLYEIIENSMSSEDLKPEHILTAEDKALLDPFFNSLLSLDVSETTAFRKLFKSIGATSIQNEEWLNELRNTVYVQNKKRLKELIQLIRNHS